MRLQVALSVQHRRPPSLTSAFSTTYPGDLIVPFLRGYAEETSWQGPCFVQQLLADSLAWRARVGADGTGQLSSCARPCPALACLAVRAPRPPPPDNGGHRLPRPLGAPSTPPTDPVPWLTVSLVRAQ